MPDTTKNTLVKKPSWEKLRENTSMKTGNMTTRGK